MTIQLVCADPIGIPVLLLIFLLRMDVPRLARYGKGDAIFQQMLGLYMQQRDKTVSSKIANYVGGQKSDAHSQAVVAQRAAELFEEVSDNGEHEVTSERLLEWLRAVDITGEEEEEVD